MRGGRVIINGMRSKARKRFCDRSQGWRLYREGKDISKMAGKLIEAAGNIVERNEGDIIEAKSIQDIQDTLPD